MRRGCRAISRAPIGPDQYLGPDGGEAGGEQATQRAGVARRGRGEDRFAVGYEREGVDDERPSAPPAAVLRTVQFDADLTPPGEPVRQRDQTALVAVHPHARTQLRGVV